MERLKQITFSAIIPAAGNSGRMGSNKAQLVYGEGESFASHLVKNYSLCGAQPVVLIMNEQQDQPGFEGSFTRVINRHVESGRSYSIFLGIQQVPEGNACFIQNIDNPFVEPGLLEQMIALHESDGFVVPVWNGTGGHPVLLGQNVVNYIRGLNFLQDFREVLSRFKRIELTYGDDRILWNINTPREYERFINKDATQEPRA